MSGVRASACVCVRVHACACGPGKGPCWSDGGSGYGRSPFLEALCQALGLISLFYSSSPPTPPRAAHPPRPLPSPRSFKYPGREDFGLKDLNIGIDMGSRVAIVGPNGAGKTTLMNLLAGDLTPTGGDQRKSHKLRIGRYAQHFVDALSFNVSPVEYLMSRFPEAGGHGSGVRVGLKRRLGAGWERWAGRWVHNGGQPWCSLIVGQTVAHGHMPPHIPPPPSPLREIHPPSIHPPWCAGLKPEQMRAMLGRFGLSGHHHLQPIAKLSGGQKARVVFAAIALSNPHILLLDEPTNHLDMQSIDALADALEEFEGGVVIISHDARLLSRVCDDAERSEVWIVEDGEVANYDGDFQDYKNELIREIAAVMDEDEKEEKR